MFNLSEKSIIYVFCPSNLATGGPEALHNLVQKLRRLGHDARIVYLPKNPAPTPKAYLCYEIVEADLVEDVESNLVIMPEVWTDKLDDFNRVQKSIWWLSLDNHYIAGQNFDFQRKENHNIIHLAQCNYVEYFLRENGARYVFHLQSNLNPIFYRNSIGLERKNAVAYNPIKGMEYIAILQKELPSLEWLPISNMDKYEVKKTLKTCKVYVDFGPHPGRDRIPREAAILGCSVIVGLRGTAKFYEDVPIPDEYKFDVNQFDGKSISELILSCMEHYLERRADFEQFRRHVSLEPRRFDLDLEYLFGSARPYARIQRRIVGVCAKWLRWVKVYVGSGLIRLKRSVSRRLCKTK